MKRPLAVLGRATHPASTQRVPGLPMLPTSNVPRARHRPGDRPFITTRLLPGLALGVLVAIATAASSRPAYATAPGISVSPAAAAAFAGADLTLDIDAANVPLPGLGGYALRLTWDPAVLSLTSLTDSGWVTSGQIIVFCTTPVIDPGVAELDCAPVFAFGSGVTTSSPRSLAQAVFHATAPGATTIALRDTSTIPSVDSELLDPLGATLAGSVLTSGTVTVLAPGSVGGIAEDIEPEALLRQQGESADGHGGPNLAAVAIAAAGSIVVVGAAGYRLRARRR